MDLDAEFKRLYRESPVEIQRQFDILQENKEKARELVDVVGSLAVDENLPLEVMEMTANLLKIQWHFGRDRKLLRIKQNQKP